MARTSRSQGAYACAECGWQTAKWVGRCAECQQWGTVAEAGGSSGTLVRSMRATAPAAGREARPITEFSGEAAAHRPTGIGELDRVLGGGLVPGAAVLFSGEPGVGKSTLLLDAAARAAAAGGRVLYASGEESTGQIRMRAERTGALHDTLFLASENDLGTVLGHVDAVGPDLLIVDSVQTLVSDRVEGGAGGPAQVREVASALIRVAKDRGMPVVLVGHVTKDGSVAGPRLLEHLVDVVCHFEGDRQTALRFLRTLKNRFGPTDEIGVFEMSDRGLREVPNPSELFLGERSAAAPGAAVFAGIEGTRPVLVEIQALVAPAPPGSPRRAVVGWDSARLSMVLAVLEAHCGVRFSQHDVYLNVAGGYRIAEPAADLAVAAALVSSLTGLALPVDCVYFGEISLSGAIRPVAHAQQRLKEAEKLGFSQAVMPASGDDKSVQGARRAFQPATLSDLVARIAGSRARDAAD